MYLSRVAAINGGCAEGTPAFNVNRLCGSGPQAIVGRTVHSAGRRRCDHWRRCREHELRAFASLNMRWASLPGRHQDGGHDDRRVARPLPHHPHGRNGREHRRQVGITAKTRTAWPRATTALNAQRKTGCSRTRSSPSPQEQKGDAVRHRRALPPRRHHGRPGQAFKPVFVKENGTVTAGNASGINDAAAAVVLMDGAAKARGAKPPAAWWPTPTRAWTPNTWHWPRACHAAGVKRRASPSTTWM